MVAPPCIITLVVCVSQCVVGLATGFVNGLELGRNTWSAVLHLGLKEMVSLAEFKLSSNHIILLVFITYFYVYFAVLRKRSVATVC